ncbi:hypothetical protein GCM10009760_07340 [Kitasatospora kazusensis]|uniref:Uncharacterized protein n=1 Tax=Kitasatospora kazusensis TaxID=407974 RepID=A0ABN2YVK4_9ACTN
MAAALGAGLTGTAWASVTTSAVDVTNAVTVNVRARARRAHPARRGSLFCMCVSRRFLGE